MTPRTDAGERDLEDNELASLVGPFWSQARVREALHLTATDLAARRTDGSILAVSSTDGDLFYPVSQFQRHDGVVEVKPPLIGLFQTLKHFDPWSVAVLLHTPAEELDGQTPLAWLANGSSPGALTEFANRVAQEWGAGGGL